MRRSVVQLCLHAVFSAACTSSSTGSGQPTATQAPAAPSAPAPTPPAQFGPASTHHIYLPLQNLNGRPMLR